MESVPTKGEGIWRSDGYGSLDGGINSGTTSTVKSPLVPNGLDRNQLAFAVNATMRGGNIRHRSVYAKRVLTFKDDATATAFKTGMWQGAAFYSADVSSLITSISGRLYQTKVEQNFATLEISIPNDLNPTNRNYAWFCQAEQFMVVQDGSSLPIIFDGTSCRRAKKNEIKPGTVMAYALQRIWYATNDGVSFRATDIAGNVQTGHAQYQFNDSVLLETENTFLNEGGDFKVPGGQGGIRAMVVPAMLDTSLGQGPLQVFTERGAFSINAPADRTTWKSVTYPIQTASQLDYGALGARSTVTVNGDVFYRSLDGIRSFKMARQDFLTWINTAISQEVSAIIESDNEAYLFWGSALNFDNRLLMTVWPRPTAQGYVHDGLIPLDFNLVSSLRQRDPAAWEGALTGLSIFQVVKGVFGGIERAFAYVLSTAGEIELWEILSENELGDQDEHGKVTPIAWELQTPSYDFNTGQGLKRLVAAALWLEDVQGTVEFVLQYRPDQYPCWIDWYRWTECAPIVQCFTPLSKTCQTLHNYKPQYRPKIKIPQPAEECNPTVNMIFKDGFEFAFRILVTGHATIKKARFATIDRPESRFADCQQVGPCLPLECCPPDALAYRIPGEGPPGGTPSPGYPYPAFPGYPDQYPPAPPPPLQPPAPFPPEPQPPGQQPPPPGPDPDKPPQPPLQPEIPIQGPWLGAWTGTFLSEYAVEKKTDDPNADVTPAQLTFWEALIANEWSLGTSLRPPDGAWHERIFFWYGIDPALTNFGDLAAKLATGNPFPLTPDEPPPASFGACWVLGYAWR